MDDGLPFQLPLDIFLKVFCNFQPLFYERNFR